VNDPAPQSTLRQWRSHKGDRRVLAGLAGVGAILGLAGPFGTEASMVLLPRVLYWTVIAAVTWSIGVLVSLALGPRLERRGAGLPLRIGVLGLVTGLAISGAVIAINAVAFGTLPSGLPEFAEFVLTLIVIAIVVTALGAILDRQPDRTAGGSAKGPPPVLARLPVEKRGRLLALSAEDHYVRVRTDRGDHMILMRLADAIAETAPEPGLQVHRSHWIARAAVRAARRHGDRAILTLPTGEEIPVSRANVPQLRTEGLL